jgi:hypothetical protein
MADWQTVRYDPTYPEPLDPEIIPLCDALNASGFVTISSCSGHGRDWPRVWFTADSERAERLARFVLRHTEHDGQSFAAQWQREVLLEGARWCLTLHLHRVYADTAREAALAEAVAALAEVTRLVARWEDAPNDR